MLSQIGPLEIVLVLAIALVVLGPKRLPDAGRSVGRGIRNFKAAVNSDDDDELSRAQLPKARAAAPPTEEGPTTRSTE